MMERRYGSFQRSLRLPDTVDQDKVEASFDNGVLKIKVPGHFGFAASCSEIVSVRSNAFWHCPQRYW
jgi:Hsp20/alpha crystallin family